MGQSRPTDVNDAGGMFRRLEANEIAHGHAILVGRTNWLNQRGIRQWAQPIPEAVLRERCRAGSVFGYWVLDELVAVVCLLEQGSAEWIARLSGRYLYLATLASDVRHKGKGYGQACVADACRHAQERGYDKVYLDCMEHAGALPSFYARLGFEVLAKKRLPEALTSVLMVKRLPPASTARIPNPAPRRRAI